MLLLTGKVVFDGHASGCAGTYPDRWGRVARLPWCGKMGRADMRLANKLTLWLIVAAACFSIAGIYQLHSLRKNIEQAVQIDTARRSSKALALIVEKAMRRELDSLSASARIVDMNNPMGFNSVANAIPRFSPGIQWVGALSTTGNVMAGTFGADVGRDMSTAPWFHEALSRPTLSHPFEIRIGGKPIDVMILAEPILGANHTVKGVMAYRLRMNWLQDLVLKAALTLGTDVFITNNAGHVLMQATANSSTPPAPAAIQAARLRLKQGIRPIQTQETGSVAFSLPGILSGTLPGSDWNLITRVPMTPPVQAGGKIWTSTQLVFAVLVFLTMGSLIIFARWLLYPIQVQSETLLDFAQGDLRYPKEFRTSREARELSSSIAFIHAKLDRYIRSDTATPSKAKPSPSDPNDS